MAVHEKQRPRTQASGDFGKGSPSKSWRGCKGSSPWTGSIPCSAAGLPKEVEDSFEAELAGWRQQRSRIGTGSE